MTVSEAYIGVYSDQRLAEAHQRARMVSRRSDAGPAHDVVRHPEKDFAPFRTAARSGALLGQDAAPYGGTAVRRS